MSLKPVIQVPTSTFDARKTVIAICDIVALRGARLAAAGIVGILKKIGRDGPSAGHPHGKNKSNHSSGLKCRKTVVAMDGGLYEHYMKFREYLHEAVAELLGEDAAQNVIVELSKDGSGIGAALLAASHSEYQSTKL